MAAVAPIPISTTPLGAPLDPKEVKDYKVDWAPLLEAGETILSFNIVILGDAVSEGFRHPPGKPAAADDTSILMWFDVDNTTGANNQSDARWNTPGMIYNIEIDIATATRIFQRTFTLQVVQR